MEKREFNRVKAKSILVSLSNVNLSQPITGFLRDIGEGGLKVQKISSTVELLPGEYECQFVLPNFGKIISRVELIGSGDTNERFGNLLIRLRFINIKDEDRQKVTDYVKQNPENVT